MNNDDMKGVKSVQRAIDVLFCFDHDTPILTAADVAARLGMNRSTAWRYLQSLTETGLIREVDGSGRYALAPRIVQLAEIYTSQWGDLTVLAGNVLLELRDATDETAALHIRQGWSRVVASQAESRQELHRTYRDIGEPLSLLLGAPSLAILAWLPVQERNTYLDRHLADQPELRREMEQQFTRAHELGYTVSKEARTRNVGSVAAPVLAADGSVVAAVNVSGPLDRFGHDAIDVFARHVRRAAHEIEHLLAGHEARPRAEPRPPSAVRRSPSGGEGSAAGRQRRRPAPSGTPRPDHAGGIGGPR